MNVIPKLQKQTILSNSKCDIKSFSNIFIDDCFNYSKNFIISIYEKALNKKFENKKGEIEYLYDNQIKQEGYILSIDENNILVKASDCNGAIYATQTIRQLFNFDLDITSANCSKIEDYPEMSWRGLLYDEARHFFGKEHTKKLIDIMSLHKLNVLHWHLSDNEGWRIEIKKYPLLTEIGSKRKESQINGWFSTKTDGIPHEGFYTQDDIKEIINYAKERGIMIIPEIDMPGHFAAASAAYSYLTCRDLKRPVPWYFGGSIPNKKLKMHDWNRSACVANEKTMQFMKDVVGEVIDLFNVPYFHIGGDEAPVGEWTKCPKCKKLMEDNKFTNPRQLQAYFINEVNKFIQTKNCRLIGWNEILKGDYPDKSIIVQYWTPQPDYKVNKHLESGGEIIISKHKYFYFDMPYSMYNLKNTYNFNPKKIKTVNNKYLEQIKGIEGAVWTEWIPSKEKFDFQLHPRMQALSEVAWNNNDKNFDEFLTRLQDFNLLLQKHNIIGATNKVNHKIHLCKRKYIVTKWFNGDQNIEYKMNLNELNKNK